MQPKAPKRSFNQRPCEPNEENAPAEGYKNCEKGLGLSDRPHGGSCQRKPSFKAGVFWPIWAHSKNCGE